MINIDIGNIPILPIDIEGVATMPVDVEVLNPADIKMKDAVIEIAESYDVYNGRYTAIPQAYDRTVLPTSNKLMKDNVTVEKVPYYETSNTYGDTVYIAEVTNG